MNRKTLRKYIVTALFISFIFICTRFLQFPIGNSGYIHLGDAFIYLACVALPFPFAAIAAAIGASLADITSGYLIWAPFTFIIKGIMPIFFTSRAGKFLVGKNIFALLFAALINAGGYYLAEVFLFGNFISPLMSIPLNLLQSTGGALLFVLISVALDNAKFKDFLS